MTKLSTEKSIDDILTSFEGIAELMNLEQEVETYVPSPKKELIYWKKNNRLEFHRRLHPREQYSSKTTGIFLIVEFQNNLRNTNVRITVERKLGQKIFFYAFIAFLILVCGPIFIVSLSDLNSFESSGVGLSLLPVLSGVGYLGYLFQKKRDYQDVEYMENKILPCIGAAFVA